jgi:hypothetical protein
MKAVFDDSSLRGYANARKYAYPKGTVFSVVFVVYAIGFSALLSPET